MWMTCSTTISKTSNGSSLLGPRRTGRPPEEEALPLPPQRRDFPIEELLTEGQEVLVQVAKSPIGTKGARISSHISIPGRFLVLMPSSTHIGISRRIEDEAERARLKQLVHDRRKEDFGYIIRTAAEGESEEKIVYEMGFLTTLWENIQRKFAGAPTPVDRLPGPVDQPARRA